VNGEKRGNQASKKLDEMHGGSVAVSTCEYRKASSSHIR